MYVKYMILSSLWLLILAPHSLFTSEKENNQIHGKRSQI